MKLNLSILKRKGFCTREIMNALLFILLYSDCPYLTALFAFCSYANPASIFFFLFLCLYCFVHSGWSRPPVFLNRGSCQCRCSNEYVQHVLQAKQRLPKNRNARSSAFKAASKHTRPSEKTPSPLKRARDGVSPTVFTDSSAPRPIDQLVCRKKLRKCLVYSPSLSWFTGSIWSGISHLILAHSVSAWLATVFGELHGSTKLSVARCAHLKSRHKICSSI